MKNRFKICSAVLAATMALASVSSVMASTVAPVATQVASAEASPRLVTGAKLQDANKNDLTVAGGGAFALAADPSVVNATSDSTVVALTGETISVKDAISNLSSNATYSVVNGSSASIASTSELNAEITTTGSGLTVFKVVDTDGSTTNTQYFGVNVVSGNVNLFGYRVADANTGATTQDITVDRANNGTSETLDLGASLQTPGAAITGSANITNPTQSVYFVRQTNATSSSQDYKAFIRMFKKDNVATFNAEALTWTSSAPSVAGVSDKGVVSIYNQTGTATITAKTVSGLTATLNITVQNNEKANVEVKASADAAYIGETTKITANFTPSDAQVPDGFDHFKYAVTGGSILLADYVLNPTTGDLKINDTAAAGQTIKITATPVKADGTTSAGSNTGDITLTVKKLENTGFELTSENINLDYNSQYTLKSTNLPVINNVREQSYFYVAFENQAAKDASGLTFNNASGSALNWGYATIAGKQYYTTAISGLTNASDAVNAVTFVSSNVAASSSFKVFAASANGTGKELASTASDSKFIKTVNVNIAKQVAPTSVTVNPTTASVEIGSNVTLGATVAPSNATDKTVAWTSSNTAIATVDAAGVVKGVAEGTVTITATTVNNKTATSSVTVTKPVEDSLEGWVSQMYQSLWGSLPAQSVIDQNVADINAGTTTTSELLKELLKSNNFTSQNLTSEQTMEALYKALFNRPADATGKAYWSERMDAGATVIGIAKGFTQAPEYKDLCKKYGVADTAMTKDQWVDENNTLTMGIYHLYDATLNRKPDNSGYNFWAERVLTGVESYASVARSFYESVEYLARGLNNSQFLDTAYQGVLRRDPDAGGKAMFTEQLNRGVSRIDVINQLLASPEFTTANADIPNLR